MRIVIDLQGAQTRSRFRGIGRYSLSLVHAIIRNKGNNEIILVLNGRFPKTIDSIRSSFMELLPLENILVWNSPGPVKEIKEENTWRREASEYMREFFIEKLKPDFILITSIAEGWDNNFIASVNVLNNDIPTAVVLYDLIPLMNPNEYLDGARGAAWYHNKISHLKCSQLLLSISESSKQEAIEYLGARSENVINISTAADAFFKIHRYTKKQQKKLKEQFGLQKEYLMFSSATDQRKNHIRLIAAYAMLPEIIRANHQLVIVGGMPDEHRDMFLSHGVRCGLGNDELIITGRVSDDEMVFLYNQCKAFIFPSVHEEFGLPALEAMCCGAAVIASNTTSLPEVIGRDDALFDPFSEEAIKDKIFEVLSNEDYRKQLIRHGIKQSKKFNWDRTAKTAINAIENHHHTNIYCKKTGCNIFSKIGDLSKNIKNTQPTDNDLIEVAKGIDLNNKVILQYKLSIGELIFRIEGPFDSSYSLALLNRETALALDSMGYNVALHSTEGPGDFEPDAKFLQENPIIRKLHNRTQDITSSSSDITSRNLYPPRVNDIEGTIRMLHHFAWEETSFPQEWVNNFNSHLDSMTCLSRHVQKIMIDNGVYTPMQVSGCGVDHWERVTASQEYKIKAKQFKFLHVSSCFPRKGVDCLLQAYGKQFTSADDVSLIIKTFSNPHNKIQQWVEEAKLDNPDYPHVHIIEDDLSDSSLKALFEYCDVLVSPSRAEGFGLPMAEAMLSGIPVITTNWSGQLDFCNTENSWLVDFEFEWAKTHFGLFSSVWAKPNIDMLAKCMHDSYIATPELRASKAHAGKKLLLENYKWSDVASRYVDAVSNTLAVKKLCDLKIAWISTWNTKCGIATYSKYLTSGFSSDEIVFFAPQENSLTTKDESNCERKWSVGKDHNGLKKITQEIELKSLNTIVIQFNYGFYILKELGQFIENNMSQRRSVIMIMHSTQHPKSLDGSCNELQSILHSLRMCSRILVHSVQDLNRLKRIGLVENVALFPHGVLDYPKQMPTVEKSKLPLISSYGFCLPHKGLEELVDAVAILKKQGSPVRLQLINAEYPDPISTTQVKKLKDLIKKLKIKELVEFNYQYLKDSESLKLLSAADLVVFTYQQTSE